jgi:hypothetical protein
MRQWRSFIQIINDMQNKNLLPQHIDKLIVFRTNPWSFLPLVSVFVKFISSQKDFKFCCTDLVFVFVFSRTFKAFALAAYLSYFWNQWWPPFKLYTKILDSRTPHWWWTHHYYHISINIRNKHYKDFECKIWQPEWLV